MVLVMNKWFLWGMCFFKTLEIQSLEKEIQIDVGGTDPDIHERSVYDIMNPNSPQIQDLLKTLQKSQRENLEKAKISLKAQDKKAYGIAMLKRIIRDWKTLAQIKKEAQILLNKGKKTSESKSLRLE